MILSTASCLYAAGYLTGIAAFLLMARRRGLLTDGVVLLMLAGLIGGLVSANVAQRVVGGTLGKTVLGGIAGGYLSVFIAKRVLGIRRPLGDLFAVALSAGEAVGRWGCFFGGCCYGKVCSLPWAVWQHGELRHPTQIYLSLANVGILTVLWRYDRTKPPENGLFYLQGLLYCVSRFSLEFLRDTPTVMAGLSSAQWACVVGILFFSFQMYSLTKHAQCMDVSFATS